jgi:hypothetical protein
MSLSDDLRACSGMKPSFHLEQFKISFGLARADI